MHIILATFHIKLIITFPCKYILIPMHLNNEQFSVVHRKVHIPNLQLQKNKNPAYPTIKKILTLLSIYSKYLINGGIRFEIMYNVWCVYLCINCDTNT